MATAFGKILLITGNAEFLADRTRARAVKAVTGEHPECQVAEASASGLQPGELAGLTSPSLFSDVSALVLTELCAGVAAHTTAAALAELRAAGVSFP